MYYAVLHIVEYFVSLLGCGLHVDISVCLCAFVHVHWTGLIHSSRTQRGSLWGLGLLNYRAEGASFLFSLCLDMEKDGLGCHVSCF